MIAEELQRAIDLVKQKLIGEQAIIEKVFRGFGLSFCERSGDIYFSNSFSTYSFGEDFWEALEANGVVLREKVVVNPILSLAVSASVSHMERGVILRSSVLSAHFYVSSEDARLAVFRIVLERDNTAPILVKRIVEGNGSVVVGWDKIGLSGIRSLVQLFRELCNQMNYNFTYFCRERLLPFDPNPAQNGNDIYLAESDQPMLFAIWKTQMTNSGWTGYPNV